MNTHARLLLSLCAGRFRLFIFTSTPWWAAWCVWGAFAKGKHLEIEAGPLSLEWKGRA